jgi:hypothetical protein
MATISQIVDENMINTFKNTIAEYRRLRAEVQLAKDAGLDSGYTVKDFDDKIAATIKIIETYTGKSYRE